MPQQMMDGIGWPMAIVCGLGALLGLVLLGSLIVLTWVAITDFRSSSSQIRGRIGNHSQLLVGRLTFTPNEDKNGRFYVYEGRADRLQPIRGAVRAARALATPAGFAGVSCVELRGIIRVA
jgi:hypothetical protein